MPENVAPSQATADKDVQVLSKVEVPRKFFNRLSLGVQALDEMFGGHDMPGIFGGSTFLFTGVPGSGKSTMCLQLAELMHVNSGRNVLYNIGEENVNMVKLRADRLKIDGEFFLSQYVDVDTLIGFCKKNGIEVLFQDSLQSLRDRHLVGHAGLRSIVKKLHAFAKDDDVTIFIVGHITKGGQFAGPQEIKHDVDVHAHIDLDPGTDNRLLTLQKNRFGPACIQYELAMTAAGLDFQQAKIAAVAPDTSRTAERRDKITKLIKDKLFQGEKISGYCFERFGVDCSGGFWRSMLARAVAELQGQGLRIAETRIDGRTHSYIEV